MTSRRNEFRDRLHSELWYQERHLMSLDSDVITWESLYELLWDQVRDQLLEGVQRSLADSIFDEAMDQLREI